MSKVLLISPPWWDVYGKVNIKNVPWGSPPTGLACIASYLEKHGISVRLVDSTFCPRGWEEVKDIIKKENPDFVGITSTTPEIINAQKVAKIVKENNPNAKVVLGGIHASALPEETVSNEYIDIVAIGEGEETMLEITEGKRLDEIRGICYKQNGKILKTPPRPLIEDLDSLPFPRYDKLPVERYGNMFLGRSMGIMSGRGCPFHCSYCSDYIVHGRRFRTLSVKNVVDQVENLRDTYNVSSISFWDDNFTVSPKRVYEISEEIIKRKLNIRWFCMSRVDTVSYELLKKMKESGCIMIGLGIESGDQKILDGVGKGITIEGVKRTVAWCNEIGISVVGYFLLGLPYDTEESMDKTLALSRGLNLDVAIFSLLIPFPGTDVWEMAKEGKVLKCLAKDWSEFKRYGDPIIELEHVSKEVLKKYQKKAIKGFYLRPKYFWHILKKTKTREDFIRNFKMAISLLGFIK
ncbi:MAG: cobalamin B12-binding domain-containing protein [Candidatus Schekmanbacteria bacterium]|nr:cobalamin B12-binding domain-containing protein [Candidatus Schekmanbacteria bacterium]